MDFARGAGLGMCKKLLMLEVVDDEGRYDGSASPCFGGGGGISLRLILLFDAERFQPMLNFLRSEVDELLLGTFCTPYWSETGWSSLLLVLGVLGSSMEVCLC